MTLYLENKYLTNNQCIMKTQDYIAPEILEFETSTETGFAQSQEAKAIANDPYDYEELTW